MTHSKSAPTKTPMHPRNKHNANYDFPALIATSPELKAFVETNQYGNESINFSDPLAVKALNKALLTHFYDVPFWDIPEGYLCPPIPGRADYIHNIADLLAITNDGEIPTGKNVRGLDIGVGANCVYPIIGHREYKWNFVGSDIDLQALKMASFIANNNPSLKKGIECRQQKNEENIFRGIIKPQDEFAFTMCNPPFHASEAEATAGSERKQQNLATNKSKKGHAYNELKGVKKLNFGGQKAELWCEGGELAFITKMAKESCEFALQVQWFTTLISKKENVEALHQELARLGVKTIKTVDMAQGQKISRFVAWTFQANVNL
ncbi:23S rRNA (adenine(1618)-N(6))-methyltransferase RlmF [Aliivibrio finisterrensis]|uniref:Ribosomal RNA large subunit methyltransferase F n=1 Tax=Aliivibrio finisterrensis TaxID=511998 RepID=A0A6N6RWG8_9GAMM|nr:23S rRNA (adenine(1618)-N(6))-methyltransferase RlmF [Aliivibrio finisterrensis]KAB2826110.1 23S rRNA (adenine(1618)-N(6))-methyltransferase RlmF [Aliivibrio finisterrensis]